MKEIWFKMNFFCKAGFIFMLLGFITMLLYMYSPLFPVGTWITGVGMGVFCSNVSE